MSEAPSESRHDRRRSLPAVGILLDHEVLRPLVELYGREVLKPYVRASLDGWRRRLEEETAEPVPQEELEERIAASVGRTVERELGDGMRRVLNASGVFLHTNLGRAPLPRDVAADLPRLLDAYCDLEIDRASGGRGERNRRAARLLTALTGAEAALVTNNNAAALLLALATLARGREVIVSRGELVEIGGSFRIPDILEASGARLVEVGTTNRTRVGDYEDAVGPQTALILKVHPSNYQISGFTETVPAGELVELARRREVPFLVDEGSGLLRPHPAPQLADHPSLSELLEAGCDLVCGSGDKMVGGPQAGLLLGSADLVERCRVNPLYRALRPDRACFGALEAVLRKHLTGDRLPIDRLWDEPEALRARLERLADRCGGEIVAADAYVGGGAAPERPIPGRVVSLPGDRALLDRLRLGEPAVVGYLRRGRVLLDLRTVDPADDERLVRAVEAACEHLTGSNDGVWDEEPGEAPE